MSTSPPDEARRCRLSGTSRLPREWEFALLYGGCRILESRRDVLAFEIRKILEDFGLSSAGGKLPQNCGNWDTQTSDARHASHLGGINRDPFELHMLMVQRYCLTDRWVWERAN